MKPIKLKLKAFGPFLEEQNIDFLKLQKEGLFLITGPTGAGKTTIFDAICFALYGIGSMGERGNLNSRSDFADEETDTKIEFEFMLKEKLVKIKRNPSYIRKRKRGEGITEQKADASLKVYENEKLIIQENGYIQVTKKVEEILNLNYEQFRQIMMIPQGEFRTFLTADSNQRADIFKKIFNIKIYEKFEDKIDENYKKISAELEKNKLKIKTISEKVQINTKEYTELIKNDYINTEDIKIQIEKEIKKIEEEKQKTILEKNKKQKEQKENNQRYEQIKNTNELIAKKENIELEIKELLNKEKYIKEIEKILEKIKKAEKIVPYEKKYEEQISERSEKQEKINSEEKELRENIEKQSIISENLLKIEKEYQKISAIKKSNEELEENIKKIQILKEKEEFYKKIIKQLYEKEKYIKEKQKIIEINKRNLEKNEKYIEKSENIDSTMTNEHIKEKQKILKSIKIIDQKYLQFETTLEEYEKKQKEKNSIEMNLQNLRKEQNEKIEKLLKNQSYKIAETLKEGQPCPVCGSINHPNPAKTHTEIINQEEIEYLNKKIEKEEEEKQNIQKKYEIINKKYNELESFIKHEYIRICQEKNIKNKLDQKKHIKNLIKETQEELEKLMEKYLKERNQIEEIKQIKENNKQIKENLKKYEKEEKSIQIEIDQIKKTETEEKIKIDQIKNEIKNKTEQEIIKERDKNIKFIQEIEEKYKFYKKENDQLLEKINSQKGIINLLKEDIGILNEKIEYTLKELKEKLEEYKMKDLEEYKKFKNKINEINKLKEEIKEYDEQTQNKKIILKNLEEMTKNLQKTDENPILKEIEKTENEIESLIKKESNIDYKIKDFKSIIEEINEIQKETEKQEKNYKMIKELRDIAKGNNESRISLSKYVLAYYFEEILDQSNQRLKKLTENRYKLFRASKVLDARKNEGLEIMVFDNYTAKEREIKTLSGGESFKAALSLALGLADIVQKHSGGVSLDTIFIDEGFGSLDNNSLDNAIEVLSQLNANGRMVGIISHVNELKERINSKIEIIPNKKGSIIKRGI
ncbi:AAA family ATPase [Oceanotoga sp. DSM 15011]|uniref:AAA family ATPase n=1 Tax=Oceanotoga sp. DSM 15011 TaxID=2984951 RepID=UPI0021F44510|nr:AAA family ATPase [Oceanotoga sp. DSM 15011]UYP00594.1 AAA family ATPase [Oceanotoga sp. DSM 15011]